MENIKFFIRKETLENNKELLNHIKNISKWEDVKEIAVFPDLHHKKGSIVPTGVVFATKKLIYPVVIKNNFNCGITVISTNLRYENVGKNIVRQIFEDLAQEFLNRRSKYWKINMQDLEEIFYTGVEWVKTNFGFTREEQLNIENEGSLFKQTDFSYREVKRNIPADVYKGGLRKLGLIWVGNHFLEMNRVVQVLDRNAAEILNLRENQIIFLIHGEPGAAGARIGKYFLNDENLNLKNRLRKFLYHATFNPIRFIHRKQLYFNKKVTPLKANSIEGRRYISCAYAAINYGFVVRTIIYILIKEILKRYFGDTIDARLLVDISHKIIKQECINERIFWIHRNGASQALGPSFIKEHPIYSKTGQLVPIPGSIITGSYLCTAKDKTKEALFSINHGTGKNTKREDSNDREDIYTLLNRESILLKQIDENNLIQHPKIYKNLEDVIQTIQEFDLINPVVKLKPIGVLKG